MNYDHLNEKTISYLDLSDAERTKKINSRRWIPYARAKEIHARLDDLFYYPKVARMPSLLVCGPSNAGKTEMLERYAELRNASESEEPNLPVLMVQAPNKPDDRELYLLCLANCCAGQRWQPSVAAGSRSTQNCSTHWAGFCLASVVKMLLTLSVTMTFSSQTMGWITSAVPRLALPLPPLPDELFTSWLVRLAAAHGLPTTSFCNMIVGKKTQVYRDLDGPMCERLIVPLSVRTGFCEDQVRQKHTLIGFGERLFPQAQVRTTNRWVLPRGKPARRKPALQACPECLASDKIPYFRRAWRLSLFVVCPIHAVRLRHLCPKCNAIISPVRGHLRHEQGTIPLCWHCGFDLRGTPGESADERDAGLARDCWKALYEGFSPVGIPSGVSARDYLAAFGIICTRLTCERSRLRHWRQMVAAGAGATLPAPVPNRGIAAFDTLSDPTLRLPILRTVGWLLESWPERFLETAHATKTRTCDFLSFLNTAPVWFLEPLRLRLTPARRAPSPALGFTRSKRLRELISSFFPNWRERDMSRIVRTLKATGLYAGRTSDEHIVGYVRATIAKLRAQRKGFQRLTRQVPRDTPEWRGLRWLALPYRRSRRASAAETRRMIILLCKNCYLSGHDLSELMGRAQHKLTVNYLMAMVRGGQLETRFKLDASGLRNHPQQAYRSAAELEG